MINRRILIFGLIGILVLSAVALISRLNTDDLAKTDDDFEILSSDDGIGELVEEEEGLRQTVMYFQNAEGYLVPVMRKLPWTEGIARSTLMNMVDGPPEGSNLRSDIPPNVKFQTADVHDGVVYVDIEVSEEFSEGKDKAIDNILKNVGLTLSEFKDVSSVELVVDGEMINSAVPVFANEY